MTVTIRAIISLFLLFFAFSAFIIFAFMEWKIIRGIAKGMMQQEKVSLPGKKVHYVLISGVLTFIGLTSLYWASILYVGAPIQPICWLSFSIVPGLLMSMGTAIQLNSASFENQGQG